MSAVHLRNIDPEDRAHVHRLLCVPKVFEYLTDGVAPSPSMTSDWIDAAAVDSARFGGGLWVLPSRVSQQILGLARLADDAKGELELTYVLHPRIWGLGYATRMAHTVMNHAFGMGSVAAVWAGADEPNVASIAVMQRLGMKFRRKVGYPAGAGVEYVMEAEAFDSSRIEVLSIS